jgi:hypothetical protein
MREGGKCKADDTVKVQMQRDTEPRTVEAPCELKKEMAKYMLEAKQEETRKRRLAKLIGVLKTGTKWA